MALVLESSASQAVQLTHPAPKRKLIVALDGVPWQAIDEARRVGCFTIFHEPARVISPFPTMTNVGMNAMMGARRSLGYENLYYDRERGRMCGGAMKYVQKRGHDDAQRGYHCLLNYQEPMPYEFLIYVFPERIFSADVARFLDAFNRSTAPVFYAFLKSTDGIIHLGGREKLARVLIEVDAALAQLSEDHRGAVEILACADHGNTLMSFERVPMKKHLARYGFELTNRTTKRRSAIIPGFGLCSYAPIYTAVENRRLLAEALAELVGVDFSAFLPVDDAFKDGDARSVTEVMGARGHARIHYDAKRNRFRYEPISGDPLKLNELAAALAAQGLLDAYGYADDSAWFEATKDHLYPDALHNIWSSVREHVESTADVLVSFEDGYCYGNVWFDRLVTLKATHGSALRSTSYAFLMSTHREMNSHLRASAASRLLRV